MDPKTSTQTFTVSRLREMVLQAAGAVGPIIEQEVMRLNDGKLPEGYAFPSTDVLKSSEAILEEFGVPMDDDAAEVMADAPVDPTQTWITIKHQEEDYLVFGDLIEVRQRVADAREAGDPWIAFRCPTSRGAVIREFMPSAIVAVAPKIAAE
jgi:hypothetical protein